MLTELTVRNFKPFDDVRIELANPVVFIGPNNSGKTSAMQALALWNTGLKRWNERRSGSPAPERRPGVTVNRRDLIAMPVPSANLLWRALRTRNVRQTTGGPRTSNIRIDVIVVGVGKQGEWKCGLEFDYANEESIYCRPLRNDGDADSRMAVPPEAGAVEVAFLPPMSGLSATETRLDPGAVDVRVGEGRTAEVLRNLCFQVSEGDPHRWEAIISRIAQLFGAEIDPPKYVVERGEVTMTYREEGVQLDLSSSGRGMQQTLLLLAYMHANPGAVVLLDEPDAHLEILRQRQIYRMISEEAEGNGCQIIAASHSEVLLNEAAGRDTVVAFIGNPHRIDDRGSQTLKALREIGFEQYTQAGQTGWVLYLEGSTDLAILQAFAKRLNHREAMHALERPFVHYIGNQLAKAESNFHGLREALPTLRGIAILDEITRDQPADGLACMAWERREIENYLCTQATLEAYAASSDRAAAVGPLFEYAEAKKRLDAMRAAIREVSAAMITLGRGSPWDADAKVSDEFLAPLFADYFERLQLPNLMNKSSYHKLVDFVPDQEIDPGIRRVLDAIATTDAESSGKA